MTEEDKNKEKTKIDLDKTVVLEQLGDEIKTAYNQELEEDTEVFPDNYNEPDDSNEGTIIGKLQILQMKKESFSLISCRFPI